MRGQEALEAMRRRGKVPAIVFIETDPGKFAAPDVWHQRTPDTAHLQAPRNGKPDRSALLCVVGLTVSVHGSDAARVHAMRDACIALKARRVIATVTPCINATPGFERFETAEVTDTEGVLSWPN